MKKPLSAILLLALVSGCASHAGPYVTSISSDGRGGLNVEKCMAKFDPWMSTVNNDQCSSTNIRLGHEAAAGEPEKERRPAPAVHTTKPTQPSTAVVEI